MKYRLLLLFLIASTIAFGQSNYVNRPTRERLIATKADSTFHIPAGATPSLRTGGYPGAGALFYDSTGIDSGLYVYDLVWQRMVKATELASYPLRTELQDTAAAIRASVGGGVTSLTKEGLAKKGDTLVIDNNRDIYYLTQPTTGSALNSLFTAVGTPGYTVSNGQFVFTGGANNRTQYIRSTMGVLSEGCYIEAYVNCVAVGATDQGPAITFKSYNPHGFAHDVEGRYVTGASATNGGKAIVFGSTGASTTASTEARNVNNGDILYYRLTRRGLGYTFLVHNTTQGWKLSTTVQTTPAGVPFVAHNSAYVAVIPGAGSYTVYGLRYVVQAPIQTENYITGNSITYRQGAASEGGGWASMVGNPSVNIIAGGGADVTGSILTRIGEIIAIKPRRVILMIGGNDILFSVSAATWKANYLAIRDSLVAHGIEVAHCYPTPRTATDVSELKIYIDTTSTFRSDIKIDTWTPLLGSGTSLLAKYNADNTHPNEAGHAAIASIVNQALHYQNNDGLYAAGSVYAYNGQLVGTTNGTGDVNKLGGVRVIPQDGTKTKYVSIYRMSGYGGIEARTEGSSYDPIVINEFGGAKAGVGETSPTAQWDVKVPGSGTVEAMNLNKSGTYVNNYEEVRLNFQNAHNTVARIAQYLAPSTAYGLKFYTYTGGGLNTNPVLNLMPNNTVKIANIPFIASKDTVMYWDPSDSTLKRTLITSGGGGGAVDDVTGTANTGIVVSPTTGSVVVSADTLLLATRAWRQKLADSLASVFGAGAYINNQFGAAQTARFWIDGTGRSDSSFVGRTLSAGAMDGFRTGGIRARALSSLTSYIHMGYNETLGVGWLQALTEGSAYRSTVLNSAGGNLGVGPHTTAPAVSLDIRKDAGTPAIKLLRNGVNPWYLGNRTENTDNWFKISYNTTDWFHMLVTGQTGFGGNSTPAAWVHPAAGTSTIGALALTSGTDLSSPTAGQFYYNGTRLGFSPSTTIKRIALTNDAAPTSGQVPVGNGTDYTLGDHGNIGGLTDDDHTQYALLAGRSGNQVLHGGVAANETLTLAGNAAASGNTAANMSVQVVVDDNKGKAAQRWYNSGKTRMAYGQAAAWAVANTNTTLGDGHYLVLVDASGGNITITLPAAASNDGTVYIIKKTDASANTVTIDGNASETIDGNTTEVISAQYETRQIQCSSSAWFITNKF